MIRINDYYIPLNSVREIYFDDSKPIVYVVRQSYSEITDIESFKLTNEERNLLEMCLDDLAKREGRT